MTKHPTYHAIRRISDGYVLPWPSDGVGRTEVEPVSPLVRPPRLYDSASAAQMALSHWAKGIVDRQGHLRAGSPVRDRSLFEVVPVEIHIKAPDQA